MTLFHNADVHSTGAVGLALTGSKTRRQTSSVEFPGLRALTPRLIVTRSASSIFVRERLTEVDLDAHLYRSEGNLVNTIDDGNPSRLLLAAIQQQGIENVASFKDAEFYLGAFRGDQVCFIYFLFGFTISLTRFTSSAKCTE